MRARLEMTDDPNEAYEVVPIFSNIAATPASFAMRGGLYSVTSRSASWGGGSATLQRLAPDNATYVTKRRRGADPSQGHAGHPHD
jgi:hypothetical protein